MKKEELATRKTELLSIMVAKEVNLLERYIDKYYDDYSGEYKKKWLQRYHLDGAIEDEGEIHFAAGQILYHQDSLILRQLIEEYKLDKVTDNWLDVDWAAIDKKLKLIKGYIEPILYKRMERLWPRMTQEVRSKYLADLGTYYKSLNKLSQTKPTEA